MSYFALSQPIFMPSIDDYAYTYVWPEDLPLPDDLDKEGNRRFIIRTYGPYGGIRDVIGLAVEKVKGGLLVYGDRRLLDARQSGYDLEGRVSIGGKKYRAFTSDKTFVSTDASGRMRSHNFAVLYVVRG
jgi:hypothetical protein